MSLLLYAQPKSIPPLSSRVSWAGGSIGFTRSTIACDLYKDGYLKEYAVDEARPVFNPLTGKWLGYRCEDQATTIATSALPTSSVYGGSSEQSETLGIDREYNLFDVTNEDTGGYPHGVRNWRGVELETAYVSSWIVPKTETPMYPAINVRYGGDWITVDSSTGEFWQNGDNEIEVEDCGRFWRINEKIPSFSRESDYTWYCVGAYENPILYGATGTVTLGYHNIVAGTKVSTFINPFSGAATRAADVYTFKDIPALTNTLRISFGDGTADQDISITPGIGDYVLDASDLNSSVFNYAQDLVL